MGGFAPVAPWITFRTYPLGVMEPADIGDAICVWEASARIGVSVCFAGMKKRRFCDDPKLSKTSGNQANAFGWSELYSARGIFWNNSVKLNAWNVLHLRNRFTRSPIFIHFPRLCFWARDVLERPLRSAHSKIAISIAYSLPVAFLSARIPLRTGATVLRMSVEEEWPVIRIKSPNPSKLSPFAGIRLAALKPGKWLQVDSEGRRTGVSVKRCRNRGVIWTGSVFDERWRN